MDTKEKVVIGAFLVFAFTGTVFFVRNTISPLVNIQLTVPPLTEAPGSDGSGSMFDRCLSPAELQEAAGFLSSFAPSGVPEGWQVAVIIREQGPDLPKALNYLRITLLLSDGSQRIVEPYYRLVNVDTPLEDRNQMDGHELGALLDVGDCLAINPQAWGRRFEDLNWGFKDREFRILKKAAVAVLPKP